MEKRLQKLRRSRERLPHYREVLELAERFLVEKCRMEERKPGPSLSIDPVEAKTRMEEGFPYLRPADAPLTFSREREYFSCLLKSFEEVSPSKYESLKRAMESKNFGLDQALKRLLDNQLSERILEEEFGPEGGILLFFLFQTLKPTFESLAKRWRASLKDLFWTQGYCPFCGGFPDMGEIRKEGKRILHCPLCGTEWEYPRMKCPYCQNDDPERLTYFQVEGEAENRVDICQVCRNYLKTLDSREMEGSLDFEVEDYLTLHLDHLAQEEGYARPTRLFVEAR